VGTRTIGLGEIVEEQEEEEEGRLTCPTCDAKAVNGPVPVMTSRLPLIRVVSIATSLGTMGGKVHSFRLESQHPEQKTQAAFQPEALSLSNARDTIHLWCRPYCVELLAWPS